MAAFLGIQDIPKPLRDLSPFNKIRLLQLARMYDTGFTFISGYNQAGEATTDKEKERLAFWDRFLEDHPPV